jgi:hypothetical protein
VPVLSNIASFIACPKACANRALVFSNMDLHSCLIYLSIDICGPTGSRTSNAGKLLLLRVQLSYPLDVKKLFELAFKFTLKSNQPGNNWYIGDFY